MSNRNNDSDSNDSNQDSIEKEVIRLFNIKDKTRYTEEFMTLRQKYKDDIKTADSIQKKFTKRYHSIYKRAQKMSDKFREKYGSLPYHVLTEKAKSYADKHDIEDYEFAIFQRMYEEELAGTSTNVNIAPTTILMKTLGIVSQNIEGEIELNETEYGTIQEILKEFELSKQLHAQTLLQSIQYTDLAIQARVETRIDRTKHNPANHIHPIIAAMFLPKINIFESHFLFSNMSGIVNSRYNKLPLTTRPDFELFYSLVTDPNDVVCDDKSPVTDLLNRCRIQHHLWNSVMHLRNGMVYNPIFNEFTKMIDNCRLNKYDNPDLVYGHHDGTIIKRLLASFSFRPTVVATFPLVATSSTNPYAQNTQATVTAIPMINIKLHAYQNINRQAIAGVIPGGVNANRPLGVQPVTLSGCLTQQQTFIERNMLVQRITDVVYSREVLIFYVDRRAHILNFGSPFNISRLPSAIAGFEKINTYPIEIECSITLRPQNSPNDDKFCLRSVVVADISNSINPNDTRRIVTGSSAFIFDYPFTRDAAGNPTDIKSCSAPPLGGAFNGNFNNPNAMGFFLQQNNCNNAIAIYHYDPMNALIKHSPYAIYDVMSGIAGGNPPPIAAGLFAVGAPVGGLPVNGLTQLEAEKTIREQGIIFIYQNFAFNKNKEMSVSL
jgi:hypothetical protein